MTMKLQIPINSIPAAGMVVEGTLSPEWVGESLLEAYRALSPLAVRIEVRKMNGNVFVQGRAQIRVGFDCSRTLEPAERDLDVAFHELFVPEGQREINLGDGIDADELDDEPYAIVDGVVDLEQLLREELVLAQDPYPKVSPGSGDDMDSDDSDAPAWTSAADDGDPRWAGLAKLKVD